MEIKTIIAIAAALLTTAFQAERWWHERSLASRRRQQMARAEELLRFIELGPRLETVTIKVSRAHLAVENAKLDLDSVLANLERLLERRRSIVQPVNEMSFVRRWFLLYAPIGWRAFVAHALFYFLVAFVAMQLDDAITGRGESQRATVFGLVIFAFQCLLVRYWAVVENHWACDPPHPASPTQERFLWYLPANGSELLARMLLALASFFALVGWGSRLFGIKLPGFGVEYPKWFMTGNHILYAWLIAMAYLWARAEYRTSKKDVPCPRFPHNLRFMYKASSVEEFLAQISFWLFSFWMILDLHYFSSAPLTVPESIGADSGIWAMGIGWMWGFCLICLFPWYGSYMWGLAAFRAKGPTNRSLAEMAGEAS